MNDSKSEEEEWIDGIQNEIAILTVFDD